MKGPAVIAGETFSLDELKTRIEGETLVDRCTIYCSQTEDLALNFGSDFTSLFIDVAGNRVYPSYLSTTAGDPNIYMHEIRFELAGDLNDDGRVNVLDLIQLLVAWGACPGGECPADLSEDGVVNVLDLIQMLARWTG